MFLAAWIIGDDVHDVATGVRSLRGRDALEDYLVDMGSARIAKAVDRHVELVPVTLLFQEYAQANDADQDTEDRQARQREVRFDGQEHGEMLSRPQSGLVILASNNINLSKS